jgi:hypothetical protein
MVTEEISIIEILESGELLILLESGGKPMYQYIYREAAEVRWDNDVKGFKAPATRSWSYSDRFKQIVNVLASGLEVNLKISNETNWVNVPENLKTEICATSIT